MLSGCRGRASWGGRCQLALVAAALVSAPLAAQRLPVKRGDWVRVSLADSAALGRWREAAVLAATGRGVLLSRGAFGADTVALALNPAVRLQLRRRPAWPLVAGTLAGAGAGVALGAIVPPSTLGAWWGERTPGHRAEMVYFGLAGAVSGWVAGWLFGPPRWQEVPLGEEGMAFRVAPLTRTSGRNARFGRVERWEVFPATEEDFAGFFWAHRDSLRAIEGLWEIQPAGRGEGGIAVVRDERYPGWEYVGISYGQAAELSGRIVFVFRAGEGAGAYEVHDTDGPGPAFRAVLAGDVLRIAFAARVEQWHRRPLVPPR